MGDKDLATLLATNIMVQVATSHAQSASLQTSNLQIAKRLLRLPRNRYLCMWLKNPSTIWQPQRLIQDDRDAERSSHGPPVPQQPLTGILR